MEGTTEAGANAGTIPATSVGRLTRRLLGGVLVAIAAFAAVARAALWLGVPEVASFGLAAAAALVVAAVVVSLIVRPLLTTQAELEDRYAVAVADSLRDPLTDLGNHRAFHEELDRQVETALRHDVPVALLLIDLDDFKSVNDRRGHAAGDRVLRGFGRLLTTGLRRSDRAFRVGGDEFAVILSHTGLDEVAIVARRLLAQALGPALRLEDLDPISFSGGVSALPELADSRSQLYAQADAALYAAKRGGRTEVRVFDPSFEEPSEDRGVASQAVADVIARGGLVPVYQPIVDLETGRVVGVEGLIRPAEPSSFSTPAELFAAADAGGRLTALDLACVEAIVAGAIDLPADRFLSVNLTPATLEAPEFTAAALLAIAARHGFPPHRLVVEVTEQQAVHDVERVRGRMATCRRAGIRFAADDIGAGNAGLRLLAAVPFEFVKVDLGLVQAGTAGGMSGAVLRSVIELAAGTGATLVAEGVEDAEQVAQLRGLGVTLGQGYHLGRPGPLAAALPREAAVPIEALMPEAAHGMAAWRQSIGLPSVS